MAQHSKDIFQELIFGFKLRLKLSQDLLPATKARSLPTDGVVAMVLGPSWRRSHPDLPEKQTIKLLGAIAQERLVCHNRSPFKQGKEDSDPLCGYPMLSMPLHDISDSRVFKELVEDASTAALRSVFELTVAPEHRFFQTIQWITYHRDHHKVINER